jgi:inorganic pyrophosphatase
MIRLISRRFAVLAVPAMLSAQVPDRVPNELPATAASSLAASLAAAEEHRRHPWRDTPPFADDGTVNAYVEIPKGERRKWEFDMRANKRAIDRVMPVDVGGYPVNYGFVPQTVSYDGDPFDVLVLGPPLPGGRVVRGVIVGLMLMEDEKGLDSKVVVSPADGRGQPRHRLDAGGQERIADYFRRYKQHETGKFSSVPGWGTEADGRAYITMTHAFFRECRDRRAGPCRIDRASP